MIVEYEYRVQTQSAGEAGVPALVAPVAFAQLVHGDALNGQVFSRLLVGIMMTRLAMIFKRETMAACM